MQEINKNRSKPLIIFIDDNGEHRTTYSEYIKDDSTISFYTNKNKITIPISRLIKIKEAQDGNN